MKQEGDDINSSAILIQRLAPDSYFTQAQHDRMKGFRTRRAVLTDAENAELDALIDAELEAAVTRTDAFVGLPDCSASTLKDALA